MKKKVFMINHHASESYVEKGGRFYWFAKYLKRAGYDPVIFCANSVHGKNEQYIDTEKLYEVHVAEEIHVPYVFVKVGLYSGNNMKRVISYLDFYRNVKRVARLYAAHHGKPDVIYASSVHPLALLAGIHLARRFRVKCICEIRDLWPESFKAFNIISNKGILAVLYFFEKYLYKRADSLVFTMENAYKYIEERGWEREIPREKVFYINNGVDIESFEKNRETYMLDDADLQNDEIYKVVYTGAIRKANNLGRLVAASRLVKSQKVKILIWGDGDEREELKRRVREEGIDNVEFKGSVSKEYVPYILSCSSLNVHNLMVSSVMRFGISSNKLFEYVASGKPVLSTFPCECNPIVIGGAGMEIDDYTPEEIAAAIDYFANLSGEEYQEYCQNAIKLSKEFDFEKLTNKMIEVIER